MNATDVMLAERATALDESMADENVPDAPPLRSYGYSPVAGALAGSGRTPYLLTIAAQLAVTLRARIGSGKLAPGRPIPGESTLMQQYGVAPETARKAVRALVAEGLVYVMEGRGAYVATRD
jgi:GntR family transcriptional regulator